MKNRSTILFLLATTVAGAQPVLNQSNIVDPPDRVIMGNAYMNLAPNVVPGNAGTSQTWNFTTTQFDARDTMNISDPNWISSQYTAAFPQCNIALSHGSGMQAFDLCTSTPAAFYVNGTSNLDPNYGVQSRVYSDPMKYMQWPMAYGTSFVDTVYGNWKYPTIGQQDSSWEIVTMVLTTTADAWGMVNYSYGANNVLRLKREITYDILFATHDVNTGWSSFTSVNLQLRVYEYWSNDNGATWPIASLTCDPATDTVQSYQLTILYTSDVANESQETSFNVYPNPASDYITIAGSVNSHWEITDGTGRIVKAGWMNDDVMEINLEDFVSGIYVMSVTGEDGMRSSRKFIIE